MSLSIAKTAAFSGFLAKTGALALFAGFSLSLAIASAPRLFLAGEAVRVDLDGLRWINEVKVGVQSLDEKLDQQIVIATQQVQRLEAAPPVAKKAKKVRVAKAKALPVNPSPDQVALSAAAPAREAVITDDERERLQGVYRLLRGRFHAAVDSTLDTQVAELSIQKSEVVNTQEKKVVLAAANTKVKKRKPAVNIEAKRQKIEEEDSAPVLLYELPPATPGYEERVGVPLGTQVEPMRAPRNAPVTHSAPAFQVPPVLPIQEDTPVIPVSEDPSFENVAMIPEAEPKETEDVPQVEIAAAEFAEPQEHNTEPAFVNPELNVDTQIVVTTQTPPQGNDGGIAGAAEDHAAPEYSVSIHPVTHYSPQGVSVSETPFGPWPLEIRDTPTPTVAALSATAVTDDRVPGNSKDQQSQTVDDSISWSTAALKRESPDFVEAYRWNDEVYGVNTNWISRDSQTGKGWALHRAEGFESTLAWHTQERAGSVPLLSRNTALGLAKMANVKLHPSLGMVFGKIPEGWVANLSGRAEQPLFIDGTFAFLNVEPGAHVLYITREVSVSRAGQSDGEAAIGIPVLAGAVTYLDIVEPKRRRIAGRVVATENEDSASLGGVPIHVIGQSRTALTQRNGGFVLDDVSIVGSYPIYLDVGAENQYRHRYSIDPAQVHSVTLFQLSNRQIEQWLHQVEGGISPESGLAVAALPKLVANYASLGHELFPSVIPFAERSTLEPEAYVLSREGEMLPDAPVSADNARFIAIEVPEGPASAALVDRNGRRWWSEIFIAQPGVINVIGPH